MIRAWMADFTISGAVSTCAEALCRCQPAFLGRASVPDVKAAIHSLYYSVIPLNGPSQGFIGVFKLISSARSRDYVGPRSVNGTKLAWAW